MRVASAAVSAGARVRAGLRPRPRRPTVARGRVPDVGVAADASSRAACWRSRTRTRSARPDDANVRYAHFEQRWTSENAVEALEAFGRVDVLMLDFYLPPVTGLEVLRQVNDAARAGRIERPRHTRGDERDAGNARLAEQEARTADVKWDVGTWSGWAK